MRLGALCWCSHGGSSWFRPRNRVAPSPCPGGGRAVVPGRAARDEGRRPGAQQSAGSPTAGPDRQRGGGGAAQAPQSDRCVSPEASAEQSRAGGRQRAEVSYRARAPGLRAPGFAGCGCGLRVVRAASGARGQAAPHQRSRHELRADNSAAGRPGLLLAKRGIKELRSRQYACGRQGEAPRRRALSYI
jgi:hypothetical protein